MPIPGKLETFLLSNTSLEIYVPEELLIQQLYQHNRTDAYWAKVWPASVALCLFLQQHPYLIRDQKILELAGGLGLSGLYASFLAQQVTITDKEPLAATFVQQSALHLGLKNVASKALNWKDSIKEALPDVVLLSDVNYEPAVFNELKQVLHFFLSNNVTVIISTPQRLVAKPFIVELLPYSHLQWNSTVLLQQKETAVSVFVLK